MTGRVVTITSGKGGVGKTTTTANLGISLAQQNRRVVVIDADIGLRNLDLVMGLENRIVYDMVDVVEGRCSLRQATVKHKDYPHLYLLPASQTRDKTAITPDNMRMICAELKEENDFILIDSPAGIEWGFKNAIAPADESIIVTNPEVSSVRDADRIIGLIEAEDDPVKSWLIVNRVKPSMVRRGEMLSVKDVVSLLAIKLLGVIPDDDIVVRSSNEGIPVTGKTREAFDDIARRLNGESVPVDTYENGGSFFGRILKLFSI
jgi:septum site-determining protein MinD